MQTKVIKHNLNIEEPSDLSREYWDEESNEKSKFRFDLGLDLISSDKKANKELKEFTGLVKPYLKFIDSSSNILSIACGNCWLEFMGLKNTSYNSFTGIDFSQHRVHKYAEIASSKIQQNCNEIDLIYGNFFDYIPEKKFDLIILSKAFHHFEEPLRLLRKIHNSLSSGGYVIIVGENYFSKMQKTYKFFTHFLKLMLRNEYRKISSFIPSYNDMFPPSYEKGDINYSLRDYDDLFKRAKFHYQRKVFKESPMTQAFILYK